MLKDLQDWLFPNSTVPNRRAFGRKERGYLIKAINYYQEAREDPPYYGIFQRDFESNFAQKLTFDESRPFFSRAVSTGSIACFLALKALQLPKNSEVILSPVTDSSPLFSIVECGLIPKIADSQPYSYNASIESIESLITKNTSAIFLVHAAGTPCNPRLVRAVADKYNLKLIEDISQAPFASADSQLGRKQFVGTFGHIGACSTMYRKSLHTSSSGGIVFSNDNEKNKRILEYADRGRPTWRDDYDSRNPGQAVCSSLNYNTNEFNCAIGIASLKRIDSTINARRYIQQQFINVLNESELFVDIELDSDSSPFLLPVFVKPELKDKKHLITSLLSSRGASLAPHYNCFVYDWRITKTLTSFVQSKQSAINQALSFNLFLNERCNQRHVRLLRSCIRNVELAL